jgi:hypothetical protein
MEAPGPEVFSRWRSALDHITLERNRTVGTGALEGPTTDTDGPKHRHDGCGHRRSRLIADRRHEVKAIPGLFMNERGSLLAPLPRRRELGRG